MNTYNNALGFDAENKKKFPTITPTHNFYILYMKQFLSIRIKIIMWRYHGPTACWTSKVQYWRTLLRKVKELCKYTKKRIEKKITKWRRDKTRGLGTHFFKRLYAKENSRILKPKPKKKCLILDIHEHNLLDVSLTD